MLLLLGGVRVSLGLPFHADIRQAFVVAAAVAAVRFKEPFALVKAPGAGIGRKGPQPQRRLRRLCDEMEALRRYLDATGNQTLEEIKERVIAKDDLDFQYANGGLLKLWLFVHVPPTYALILAILAHFVVAYAFSSGIA